MSVKDELLEISGVGEATAEEILTVVESETVDESLRENVREAWECYEAGEVSYARKYLERAYEGL